MSNQAEDETRNRPPLPAPKRKVTFTESDPPPEGAGDKPPSKPARTPASELDGALSSASDALGRVAQPVPESEGRLDKLGMY